MAQASELSQMHVADPRASQLLRQGLSVELRVVSRSRDTANVDDALDAVRPQKCEEIFPCAGRMPNRQHKGHFGLDLSHDEGLPTAEYSSIGTLCPCSHCVRTKPSMSDVFSIVSQCVSLARRSSHTNNGMATLLGFWSRYFLFSVFGSTTSAPRR